MDQHSGIVIRPMAEKDVPALVELHAEVFKGYNSTVMGPSYLKSLYGTLAGNAACISVVALEGGKVFGWIGGVGDWRAYQKALMRRSILRVPAIFFSILKRDPALLGKALGFVWDVALQFVHLPKRRSAPYEKVRVSRQAALLAIGVAPHRQNQGLGQVMMAEFHRRLLVQGFTACTASTFADNDSGNKAFQKAGYRLYQTSNSVNYYIKDLVEEKAV